MKNIPLYEVRKIKDLRDMLQQSTALYGEHPAFMVKKERGGPYVNVTMKEYADDVNALGTALLHHVSRGSRVAILAETRYEWYVSYLAVTNGTGVVVPLDKELPKQEIASLVNRAEVDVLIYASSKQQLVDEIIDDISGVKKFICMDRLPERDSVLYFGDLLEEGKRLLAEGDRTFLDAPLDPETMTILLFTSGTTDEAKAVMLSHRNICANLEGMCAMAYIIGPEDTFLSWCRCITLTSAPAAFYADLPRLHHCHLRGAAVYFAEHQGSQANRDAGGAADAGDVSPGDHEKVRADKKLARKFALGLKLRNYAEAWSDLRRKIFAPVHENFGAGCAC